METIKYYHKNSDVVAFKKETYSRGFSTERTYDENGNVRTFKNSDGYSWERTYDKKDNERTYKNSEGVYAIKGKKVTKEQFEAFIHRPLVGKKIKVDDIEYELK